MWKWSTIMIQGPAVLVGTLAAAGGALALPPAEPAGPAPAVGSVAVGRLADEGGADEGGEGGGDGGVEGGERAKAVLAEVSDQKQAAYKLTGEEREAALLDVAAAYGVLADDATLPRDARGEAAFRAGEILRARKLPEPARARFAQAASVGSATFAARGLLELGHLDRREHRVAEALARYAEIAERLPEERRVCAHARTWTGKLLLDEARVDAAEPVLLGFAEAFPEYPVEAVRNADLIAVRRVQDGQEEAARRILDEIRARMQGHLLGDGAEAEEIRGALDALRVTVLLAEV